ncbi:hypothetical protein Q9966_016826 [Columba livia]|nr:hypothetical protein Q9966_016826 [Columba livia]
MPHRAAALPCSPLGEQSPASSEGSQQQPPQPPQQQPPKNPPPAGSSAAAGAGAGLPAHHPIAGVLRGGAATAAANPRATRRRASPPRSTATPKCQSSYTPSTPKPSSVIASQSPAYSPGQAQTLLAMGPGAGGYGGNPPRPAEPGGRGAARGGVRRGAGGAGRAGGAGAAALREPGPDLLPRAAAGAALRRAARGGARGRLRPPGAPPRRRACPPPAPRSPTAPATRPPCPPRCPTAPWGGSSPSPIIRPLQSPPAARPQSGASPAQSQKYLGSVLSPLLHDPRLRRAGGGRAGAAAPPPPPPGAPAFGKGGKGDAELLGAERSEDEDFLIQHLLQAPSPPPRGAGGLRGARGGAPARRWGGSGRWARRRSATSCTASSGPTPTWRRRGRWSWRCSRTRRRPSAPKTTGGPGGAARPGRGGARGWRPPRWCITATPPPAGGGTASAPPPAAGAARVVRAGAEEGGGAREGLGVHGQDPRARAPPGAPRAALGPPPATWWPGRGGPCCPPC